MGMDGNLYYATAIVKTYPNWIVAYVDKDIATYYRSLVPKAKYIQPPMYDPHITIVRKDIENIELIEKAPLGLINTPMHVGYYDGYLCSIEYDSNIKTDGVYYWLDCWSKSIGDIRESLGLSRFRDGFDRYHITIGNTKK